MIPVTKPYLPSREKLDKYIDGIYERQWLTNNGPLVQELTKRLEQYLGVENLLLVSNGTLALQIAYRALGIHEPVNGKPAEAITTPFTFVATSSSLKWEGIEPVFADIDPDTWCLDPTNIGPAITPQTKAIVPVHVFGNACDVEAIDEIARKNNLKVIYDAAHAFGVKYKDESLLKWGDAATLSFHATKVFHTIEGGAIIFNRKEDLEKAKKLISFGISGPETIDELGINAKMNEFQAAMGLAVLENIEDIIAKRRKMKDSYIKALSNHYIVQRVQSHTVDNGAYMPIVFNSEKELRTLLSRFSEKKITPRRYFYPSLDSLDIFTSKSNVAFSSNLAQRILCLPIFHDLKHEDIKNIIELITDYR
jgi:dTDP-4-amino-4,6-dideoxygalactose transaminase